MKRRLHKIKRKLKNIILITITWIAALNVIFSGACLDTDGTYVFYISIAISLVWIILFMIANKDRLERWH